MKNYRSRNLSIRCQVAKDDGSGQPQRDEKGNFILDHGGQWFYKVSGSDAHEHKRLVPVDPDSFFKLKAKEVEEALRAEGVSDVAIAPEEVYEEYTKIYNKPGKTFAPQGRPEDFSIVLPKQLCINFQGGGPSAVSRPAVPAAQNLSIFARIKAARGQASASQSSNPAARKTKAS